MGASAGPYGYTLTIWTSGAVLIHARGVPDGLRAILFMLGGVAAFAIIGSAAFRWEPAHTVRAISHPVLWASFNFLPAIGSVAAVTLFVDWVGGVLLWPVAGFFATSLYLLSVAGQMTLLEAQEFESFDPEPREARLDE
ncbi:MAG TPA: hypothetical protein VIJ21_06985 [Solirubrobacterales bacterium]